MAKRHASERDNGELEFTRAAWDAIRDAEKDYHLDGVVMMSFDRQRGVLQVDVQFWDIDMGANEPTPCRVSMTWPNASGSTFGAFLFQQTNKACQMAAQWFKDKEGYTGK